MILLYWKKNQEPGGEILPGFTYACAWPGGFLSFSHRAFSMCIQEGRTDRQMQGLRETHPAGGGG